MIGTISLATSLFFALLAAMAYGYAMKVEEEQDRARRWGRWSLLGACLAAVVASIYLWAMILGDHFEIAYVASYSSRELPLMYKISAFWAGQQGSLLLWLLIHALASLYLCGRERMTAAGLTVYSALESLLVILVLAKSPFVASATAVQDGVGLNPLLQDPWMAVPPPIIFIGYALLAVPFAYAMGALLKDEAKGNWLEPARRWALLAWGFLGAGVFIGGYWAYKVLGWGGYWGWDPVENSSLVPWLLACALLHLLAMARTRPGVLPVTHLAALFTYAFVLYGTFLTRSGILGDFSVHSFAGTSIGLTLAVVNGIVVLAGLALLFVRADSLPQTPMYDSHASRPFFVLLGMLLLVFVAAIVFVGMSMPLLTQLMGKPAAVDTSFYTKTTAPLAAILAALMLYAFAKRWIQHRGAWLAHIGTLLALLAIVTSASGTSETATLAPGETQTIAGHEVTFEGQQFEMDGSSKAYVYTVDGNRAAAMTKLKPSGEDAAREPAILRGLMGDLYLAPTPPEDEREEILLKRGKMQMDDVFAYRYEDVTMEPEGDHLRVTADVAITDGETVEHAAPVILATDTGGKSEPVSVMDGKKRLRLTGVSGDQGAIRLELLPSIEELESQPVRLQFSTKPWIWVLFVGAGLVVIGGFVAMKEE